MKIRFVPLFCLLIALCGCVTTQYSVVPYEAEDVTLITGSEGQGAASVKINSIVVMEPHSTHFTSGERPGFNVSVINAGAERFRFGVDNMSARYNETELEVLDEETLVKEAESKKAFSDFINTASAVLAGVSAAYGEMDMMTLNMLTDALQSDNEQAKKLLEQSLREYRETVLKTETVESEGQHGGFFLIEKPGSMQDQGIFEVTVNVADEEHNFRFESSKAGN